MQKKTKIVCTVGPSTDQAGILEQMLAAGMNVARCNFSHGTHPDHAKRIERVRQAATAKGLPVALMLDTKGPEMRIGKFTEGKVELTQGQTFTLTARDVEGTKDIVSVNHKGLPDEVAPGNIILLSDGLVSLEVVSIEGEDIKTRVLNSGALSNNKRVAAPGVSVNLPPLSEQDIADILFGVSQNMDFVAASFVQRAADILAIRRVLEDAKAHMDIIAKIENAEGVKNIDEILNVADGLMVARGDLGVEIPAEEVPLVQKMLIKKANLAGKPVITATQMLESMITNPRPTRAEASDVANAIMDGSDAIMLSGETASGAYPVEAVETMARIALRTESALNYREMMLSKDGQLGRSTTDAISHATVQVAHDLQASAIITSTESGHTARMVSKYRPHAAIVAVTPHQKTLRRLLLQWGVHPVLGPNFHSTDELFSNAVTSALSTDLVNDGDLVVITAGLPVGTTGTTNLIRVHVVGNILMKGMGIGKKSVTGKACVVHSLEEIKAKFQPDDILIISGIDEDTAPYAAKAAAIVAEEAGLTSNAAIIGISYGMPVLVGVEGVTNTVADGTIVTVDAARGILYQGQINAR